MMKYGSIAPDSKVLLSEGTEVQLSRLWLQGTIVLVFLRHFG